MDRSIVDEAVERRMWRIREQFEQVDQRIERESTTRRQKLEEHRQVLDEERQKIDADYDTRKTRNQAKRAELIESANTRFRKYAAVVVGIITRADEPKKLRFYLRHDAWTAETGLFLLAGLVPASSERATEAHLEVFKAWSGISGTVFDAASDIYGLGLWRDHTEVVSDWSYVRRSIVRKCGNAFKTMQAVWASGQHPERSPPQYFIDWAASKGFDVPWVDWAVEQGLASRPPTGCVSTPLDDCLGDRERESLQKQVAALALVLAEKSKRFKNGDAPNAKQIADAVSEILDALPDANRFGVSPSSIRESIRAGLSLLSR